MDNLTKARLLFFSALVLLDTVVAIPFIDYHSQFVDHELTYERYAFETEDIRKIVNGTVERLVKLYPDYTITFDDNYSRPRNYYYYYFANGTRLKNYHLYFYRTGYSIVFNVPAALIIVVLNCVFAVIIYDPDKFFSSPKIDEFKYD